MKPSPPVLSLSQTFIIVFCLFHMIAVAVYSLPDAARDEVTYALRRLGPVIRPYMLLTSQWQQWNLFSPDPLQRSVTYRIEKEDKKGWSAVTTVDPRTASVFRRAAEFKVLNRLLEGGKPQLPLVANFLQQECTSHALPAGTHVRIVYVSTMIPVPRHPLSFTDWHNLYAPEKEFIGSETLCGWPLESSLLRAFP